MLQWEAKRIWSTDSDLSIKNLQFCSSSQAWNPYSAFLCLCFSGWKCDQNRKETSQTTRRTYVVQFLSFLSWEHWDLIKSSNDWLKVPARSIRDWADSLPFGSTFIFSLNEGQCLEPRLIIAGRLMAESQEAFKPCWWCLIFPQKYENKWAASRQKAELSWCSGSFPGSKELCSFLLPHPREGRLGKNSLDEATETKIPSGLFSTASASVCASFILITLQNHAISSLIYQERQRSQVWLCLQ